MNQLVIHFRAVVARQHPANKEDAVSDRFFTLAKGGTATSLGDRVVSKRFLLNCVR